MVSKARLDLPLPDRPVMTTSRSRGSSTVMFLRLCSRAPRTTIESWVMRFPAALSRALDPLGAPLRGRERLRPERGLAVDLAVAQLDQDDHPPGRAVGVRDLPVAPPVLAFAGDAVGATQRRHRPAVLAADELAFRRQPGGPARIVLEDGAHVGVAAHGLARLRPDRGPVSVAQRSLGLVVVVDLCGEVGPDDLGVGHVPLPDPPSRWISSRLMPCGWLDVVSSRT